MEQHDQQFANLIDRVTAGSEEAARELIERHEARIYQVIRRRLNKELRSKFDSQDFFQAVWASFFADRPRIASFKDPDKLVAYLGGVAANKVVEENRRRLATTKHDVRREQSINDSQIVNRPAPTAKDFTPSQIAIATEQLELLIHEQPSHYKRIVELRAEGLTYEEISQEVGMAARSVRRIIKKLIARAAR